MTAGTNILPTNVLLDHQAPGMTNDPHAFFAVSPNDVPWLERFNEKIGDALFRKDVFEDPETSMLI